MQEFSHELRAEDLGARMRAVRELAGAHPREVARAAGLSRRELQAAERGTKQLTPDELRAVAGALGIDPEVLVGVGYDGELVRTSVEDRIDQVVGHDPDHWHDFPASVDDLPPALPVDLPNPERRNDLVTRDMIERSWREVRDEMGDTLAGCARIVSAASGDDVRALLERLEHDLTALKAKRAFLRRLADHERLLERARTTGHSAGTDAADSPVGASDTRG